MKEVCKGFRFKVDDYNVIDLDFKRSDPYLFIDYYTAKIERYGASAVVKDRLYELVNKLKESANEQDLDIHTDIVIDDNIKDEIIKQFKEFIENKLDSLEDYSNDIFVYKSESTINDEHICFNIVRNIGTEKHILKEIKIPVETEISETLHYTVYDMTGKEHKFTKCSDNESVTIKCWPQLHNFSVLKNGVETDFIYFTSMHIDRDRTITYYLKKQ